ncbi:MAG: hypothetical protein ACE5HV_12605, partial [Acidobacteriota bacterium]
MSSLDESLRLIFPVLLEVLVHSGPRPQLRQLASVLAPIHCAGYECRLGRSASRVDLQQRVLASDDEPRRLRDHIVSAGLLSHPVWRRITDFCDQWQDPASLLYGNIIGSWLEFDLEGLSSHTPIPSLFMALEAGAELKESAAKLFEVVEAAVESLRGRPLTSEVADNLRSCLNACPEGAGISDVGVMLSRRLDALRVVVGPLAPRQLLSYLGRIGWPGTLRDVEAAIGLLPGFVTQLLVSLDVGAIVYPRVGLEYFPGEQPADGPQWAELLDALVEDGLCVPEKRDALLAWPGYVHPTECVERWPDSLIAESLLRPPDRFSVIGRRLNHIKVVCREQRPLEAKAYFGFGPLWLQPEPADDETDPRETSGDQKTVSQLQTSLPHGGQSHQRFGRVDRADLERAIRSAVTFLMDSRDQDGWWRDFHSVEEGSDEWVSAYVGAALAVVPSQQANRAAREAWHLLADCRRPPRGWGYNHRVPADADSTVWGLRLACALGDRGSRQVQAARRLLEKHQGPDGGLACYTEEACPRLIEFLGDRDMAGLCTTHTCITAAAAVLAHCGEGVASFLRVSQCDDGSWVGHWWCDDEYATALAAEALACREDEDARRRVRSAAQWAMSRVGGNGAVGSTALGADSAFATALCTRILALSGDLQSAREFLEGCVRWLLEQQAHAGSWSASALMRIPLSNGSDLRRHAADTIVALDDQRL